MMPKKCPLPRLPINQNLVKMGSRLNKVRCFFMSPEPKISPADYTQVRIIHGCHGN